MSYQRIEVLTGSERRRQYTEAEKERLVDAAFRPGVVVSEAARRLGVHQSLLYRWRRQREAVQQGAVQVGEVSCDPPPTGFIGVTVMPSPISSVDKVSQPSPGVLSASPSPLPPEATAVIEVVVNGDVRVRLPVSTPPALAAAVVTALAVTPRGRP